MSVGGERDLVNAPHALLWGGRGLSRLTSPGSPKVTVALRERGLSSGARDECLHTRRERYRQSPGRAAKKALLEKITLGAVPLAPWTAEISSEMPTASMMMVNEIPWSTGLLLSDA